MRWSKRVGSAKPGPTVDWRSFDPDRIIFPTWLVNGLIPEHSTCCVYGAPNTGKSFLVLDMALAIATGREWLDMDTRSKVGKTKERGKVVYFLAENPEGLNRRIAAWLNHHKIPWKDGVKELAGHFFIPLVENLHLDRPEDLSAVIAQIRDICPDVSLIIFDPLVSFMGGDENSARDTQALIQATRALVEAFKASHCSVLLVHHSGKEYAKAERGSSALRGGVETHLELTSKRLKVVKQRDADKSKDIPVEFVTVVESIDDVDRDLGMVVVLGRELPPKEAKTPSDSSATTDSGSSDKPTTKRPPPVKEDPRKVRTAKNRQTILDVVTRLSAEEPDRVVTAAQTLKQALALGKKHFQGSQTVLYDLMAEMAQSTDGKPAVLTKCGNGKYKLASHFGGGVGQESPVYSSVVPSQDDPSRPAEEAAPEEGQQP